MGTMTMIEVEFGPGSSGPEHVHSHEQIGFVLKGELELRIDGRAYALKEGYSYWIPSNILHSMRGIGDGGVALEVFHPVRRDLLKRQFAQKIEARDLKGSSAHHSQFRHPMPPPRWEGHNCSHLN